MKQQADAVTKLTELVTAHQRGPAEASASSALASAPHKEAPEQEVVKATPQTTIFGVENPSLPALTYTTLKSGTHGAKCFYALKQLSDVFRELREWIRGTHTPPSVTAARGCPWDLSDALIQAAAALFRGYSQCPDDASKRQYAPDTIRPPEMHPMTVVYLRRVVPLLRARVPKTVHRVVSDEIWDRCDDFQVVSGWIYCYHRRLGISCPDAARDVVAHLRAGPFVASAPSQQLLEG